MEFIQSLPKLVTTNYYIVTDTLKKEFDEIAPIEKGRWHWRSIVVLVGVTTSSVALVLSLFQSSGLVSILSLVTTAVLCFAIYFVSRYEEQRRMALLLEDFEDNNEKLETQVSTLKIENKRLDETRVKLEVTEVALKKEVTSLSATHTELKTSLTASQETAGELSTTNSGLQTTLAEIKQRETDLHSQHERYVEANERGSEQITARLEGMRIVDEQCREREAKLKELQLQLRHDAEELGSVKAEVVNLTQIRQEISGQVGELKTQIGVLQRSLSNGSSQQTMLKDLLKKLEGLVNRQEQAT